MGQRRRGVGLDETLARVHRIAHEHVEDAADSAAWTTVTALFVV